MILSANKNSEDSKKKLQLFGLQLKIALVSLLFGTSTILKHHQFLGIFFPANFQPNLSPQETVRWAEEARDCNVGDPKVQKMAWLSGVCFILWEQPIMTPRFCFKFCCWVIFWGSGSMVIFG